MLKIILLNMRSGLEYVSNKLNITGFSPNKIIAVSMRASIITKYYGVISVIMTVDLIL